MQPLDWQNHKVTIQVAKLQIYFKTISFFVKKMSYYQKKESKDFEYTGTLF